MLQQINKKRIYFYILSFLFLSTILNNNISNIFKNNFLIKNINIKTENYELKKKVLMKLKYLLNQSIFKINKSDVLLKLENLTFLEKIKIKKKYPSTLEIQVYKTDIIAITYINQKKFYIGKNKKFIPSGDIDVKENFPLIFGNFEITEFIDLKKILFQENINYGEIAKLYFHKNKRWDVHFKNDTVLMLPNKNISNAIKIYKEFLGNNSLKINTIIDLRVKNRLIVTND